MKKLLLIALIILISTFDSYSQSQNGEIKGKVIEANNNLPIPFANVLIVGTNLGASTDLNGNFLIKNVPVGIYQLRASVIGYTPQVKNDIMVKPNRITEVNFELVTQAIEIENVVVQADYFDKNYLEPVSVRKFSQEELRRSPGGFEDVVRALSVLPGIAQADAGRNDLVVRGGAPSENLYVVDGYEIPNINHFGTQGSTGGPISFINLDFVEDVKFSTGGFPVLYGDKVSSTLTINLREGDKQKFGGKGTLSATLFGLDLEGPVLGEKSSFIFSARRSYLDFIFKAAGFSFVPEYYDVFTKFDYKIDNINSLNFLFIGAFDNVKFFNDTPEKRNNNARILGSDQIQYISGITYKRVFRDGFMNLRYYRNFTDYNTRQSDSLLNPIFKNISREEENNLQLDVVHKFFKNLEMNFGTSLKFIEFDAQILFPTFVTSFRDTLPQLDFNRTKNFFKGATYINFNYRPFSKLTSNIGLRYDYFNAINSKSYLSPRLSLSYLVNDYFTLNLSAGIYKQFPSLIWLVAYDQNRNLKPIDVKQYILGFDYLIREDTQIKIETFIKNYSDYPTSLTRPYLVLANTGAGFAGSDDNFSSFGLDPLVSAGSGFARGVEFSIQKKMSEIPLYGIFSLTYSKSDFKSLDGFTRSSNFDQNWLINLSGGYRFNMYWEVSTRFRFASGRPYTPFDDNGIQYVNDLNSKRLKSIHSLDVRVDRRWIFKNWTLITYIDIQNIYNRRNLSGIRWDPRTRTVDETSSIGILPSIGISAEF
ncbi:MAG: TonB-dependent receptor [Ignavibacteria bacterium]|jgi:outer membrane receptor for ferrienterochelin and colicin|nr:TonB-dependent receptor [Ignavibacteria bacterium]MDH7526852.1 TonB-dependent receptor [Ignavibacteria bacterium]NPV11690.1 TonB-dependent receptor [Ignavibacteria bacterium]